MIGKKCFLKKKIQKCFMKDNKIVLTFFQKLNILDKKFEEYTEIGYL